MTNPYLKGFRTALVCAALVAVVFAPVSTPAQKSVDDRGSEMGLRTGTYGDDVSNVHQPRLYPRSNYVWPYATGPYYGDVAPIAVAIGAPGVVVTSVGAFNLAQGSLPFPEELKQPNRVKETGAQYFIVTTSSELDVLDDVMGKIEGAGGAVVEYLANGSIVAKLNPQAHAAIQDSVGTMAVVPYHGALKLDPSIGREPLASPIKAMSEVYTLDVMLWPGENGDAVATKLAGIGADIQHVWGDQIRLDAHRALLPQLADLDAVKVIYETLDVFPHAEETTTTMQTGNYNLGAIPYHDAGVDGSGGPFGFCNNGTEVCRRGNEGTDCTDGTPFNGCNLEHQILMVLDSGIQLDAGDLSDTSTSPGTVGASHRKVLLYETTSQYGGVGDLLGCDAPQQGGFTHGHVVSTTALGNATAVGGSYGTPYFAFDQQGNPFKLDGVAPGAKLIAYDGQLTPPTVSCADPLQDTISPGDVFNQGSPTDSSLGDAYAAGARIMNFSWGTTANSYNANAADIDLFLAANRDAMVFVSAGNNGQDNIPAGGDAIPDELTLGAPATTKNGLAIGASRNANTIPSPESREFFSSVGPAVNATTVNRIAPQLMAPGGEPGAGSLGLSSEFACRSNDNDQVGAVQCDIIQGVEGTSFSSPAAAGAGLLVRDYFFQGFYPNRVPGVATSVPNVSGALVKAVLAASADFMTGANLTVNHRWNNEQGMGRIQLDNVLPLENWPASPSGLVVHDTLNGAINVSNLSLSATVTSGNSTSSTFEVCNDEEELRIALVWNDVQNQSLRNNLNLEVTSPSGKTYRGNYYSDDNNRSGVPDIGEDCPGIGDLSANAEIDEGPWSLPVCANSAIPGFSNTPVAFDQTNTMETVMLSPNPTGAALNSQGDLANGTCVSGDNLNGIDGSGGCGNDFDCTTDPTDLSDNPACDGGTQQTEIGTWSLTVSAGTPFTPAPQDYAVVIAGGVCVGSSVKFDSGFYTCNAPAEVLVTELAEAGDGGCNGGGCPISTIESRTTVRAYDENDVERDCEGPGCAPPSASLDFNQANPQALIFDSDKINLTDGTVATPGNGVLDVRDGWTIEVQYNDNGTIRTSSSTVGCQVAIGFGDATFGQFGQDQAILVQGGCERAAVRAGETQGFFEYGFPDRYMDADELIQFNFAFESEEAGDLNNVLATLKCVNVDADSPAECLPNGSGCIDAECGGTCDPRRENNTTCPWMSILNNPVQIAELPSNAAISANFAIQMASEATFSGATPTVEMVLEVQANAAGKTASGIAVSRQRLNIDEVEVLYNTDYPTGGIGIVFDYNGNEVADNPITDPAGFQADDYRFETKTYGDLTSTGRNLNLQSPWNFDGTNGGFTNGLASITDEASAQSNSIANWGEDKNFNGVEDGVCQANTAIACYDIGSDANCLAMTGIATCVSIEDNNQDASFSQNHNQLGGCGWQTRAPNLCTIDPDRTCFANLDCAGSCQDTNDPLSSSFDACGTGLPPCPGSESCIGNAGTCDGGSTATTGGVWHTGQIGEFGVGACTGIGGQCAQYRVITTTNDQLIWWDLLLTPVMEKVDQTETAGVPNSGIEIGYWAWNQSVNLSDNNVAYSWEFDTDTEAIFPVDLIGDGTALDFAVGGFGAVADENNPELTNGTGLFAPMGTCAGSGGTCEADEDCPPGSCSLNPTIDCFVNLECSSQGAGTCLGADSCVQSDVSVNGSDAQGNNRVGQNSCFFEGPGVITPTARQTLGLSLPIDNDVDDDGDSLIDEFVTANGPIRNADTVNFNGPDMRFATFEDIFGDTGNTFQGAIGFLNFEGTSANPATQSYGLAIDDMYVEWREFTRSVDVTSCASGSCAAVEVPTTNVYVGNTEIPVSILDATPYNRACVGGTENGNVCFSSDPSDCTTGGGSCLPTTNDCDQDGVFNEVGDDNDCNDNGTPDIVARATSEEDTVGVVVVLDNVGGNEYAGVVTVSLTAKSENSLFIAENGDEDPTVTVTYRDFEDGTGHLCQNDLIEANQGRVQAATTVFVPSCDLAITSTTFSDNGDGDLFADTDETVEVGIAVRNSCGIDLTDCTARVSSNSPYVECIQKPEIVLGDIPEDADGLAIADLFRLKIGPGADRALLGLGPGDALSAQLAISMRCNEIDSIEFPQTSNLTLDLNLSDLGQVPSTWLEGFEGTSPIVGDLTGNLAGSAFTAENLDAGLPGNNNAEGLANADGWRCQYSDPDWVNAGSYGDTASLNCYPGFAEAIFPGNSDLAWWNATDERAKTGANSMYFGVDYGGALAGELTTPLAQIESAASTLFNLGVDSPSLSFWHQVTLADHRMVAPVPPLRSADRGVVQIRLADNGGSPTSSWMNLTPIQNTYDEQAMDNFFACTFDPVDDGSVEDDFFDPTDPLRDTGPSSTCFPEFSYGFNGDTDDPFNVGNIGNADTPPAASDAPSVGPGTWIETVVDLSEFRGRRAQVRFMTSGIKAGQPTWEDQFELNPSPLDDGWWVDDVLVDEVLTNPAEFVNDPFDLGTCSVNGDACIGQCRVSFAACNGSNPCGPGEGDCVLPCPVGQTCNGAAPSCGATCTTVMANVFTTTPDDELNNPGSVTTQSPGQVVSFNAAEATDVLQGSMPSTADSCLSGTLQYRFCISGDPDGGGPGVPDGDCGDDADTILRGWTENAQLAVAPQQSAAYVVEVRCSTAPLCADSERIDVNVTCPGSINALGLADLRAASTSQITWAGDPLPVDVWISTDHAGFDGFSGYPGTSSHPGSVNSISTGGNPSAGLVRGFLVKADGNLVSSPKNSTAYLCNSKTWRSGGSAEIAENDTESGPGRDTTLGNDGP